MNKVLIVGRPNVGKSQLFNAITRSRQAITLDEPGITRDLITAFVNWNKKDFLLIDSAGINRTNEKLGKMLQDKITDAISQANVILFVVDLSVGLTEQDLVIKKLLKTFSGRVIVVANKADISRRLTQPEEFLNLGYGEPICVSATQRSGISELLDFIVDYLKPTQEINYESHIKVGIVGKPNAGKSSLFNCLLGQQRAVVYEEPGTTRDPVTELIIKPEGNFYFVDTAGLRRKAKTKKPLEYYCNVRVVHTIERCDVVLLVIDTTIGVTHQDLTIAQLCRAYGKAMIIVLNKWDLIHNEYKQTVLQDAREALRFIPYAPIITVSSKTKRNVEAIFNLIKEVHENYQLKISVKELNDFLKNIALAHKPKSAKVTYITQGAVKPPTFIVFSDKKLEASWLRYLENQLRENFELNLTPIKIRVRIS